MIRPVARKRTIHIIIESPLLEWIERKARQTGIKADSIFVRMKLQELMLAERAAREEGGDGK